MTRSAPGHWLQGSSESTPWPAIPSQQGWAASSSILPNSSRSTAQLWRFLWPKASSNRLIGLKRGKICHHHHPSFREPDLQPPSGWSRLYFFISQPVLLVIKLASLLRFSFTPNTYVMFPPWEYKQTVRSLYHSPIYSGDLCCCPRS